MRIDPSLPEPEKLAKLAQFSEDVKSGKFAKDFAAAKARPPRMKGLTVIEPIAAILATGLVQSFGQDWSTTYRGPLAIHAHTSPVLTLRLPAGVSEDLVDRACALFRVRTWRALPRRAIVATCELWSVEVYRGQECLTSRPPPLRPRGVTDVPTPAPPEFVWSIGNVHHLGEPLAVAGASRLWDVDKHLALLREEPRARPPTRR